MSISRLSLPSISILFCLSFTWSAPSAERPHSVYTLCEFLTFQAQAAALLITSNKTSGSQVAHTDHFKQSRVGKITDPQPYNTLTNSHLSITRRNTLTVSVSRAQLRSVRKIGIIRQSRAVLLYFSEKIGMQIKVKDTLIFKCMIIK